MITDRIGRHEVLLPIKHKNYDFREKINRQVMKEKENLHSNTTKVTERRCKHSNYKATAPPTAT